MEAVLLMDLHRNQLYKNNVYKNKKLAWMNTETSSGEILITVASWFLWKKDFFEI